MKYFAIARNGVDGHAFAFTSLIKPSAGSRNGLMTEDGCERPCEDISDKVLILNFYNVFKMMLKCIYYAYVWCRYWGG